MSVPQISALARAAESASADDSGEQGLLMMRVRELEKLMRDAHAHDLASCLSAAAGLAELLSKEGEVGRAAVHEATCRILRSVEQAFSGGAPRTVRETAKNRESLPLINDMMLGTVLVQLGHVTDKQIRAALALQHQTGRRIGDLLVDAGLVERDVVEGAHRIQRSLRREAEAAREQASASASAAPAPAGSAAAPLALDKSGLRITEPPPPPQADALRRRTNDYLLGQILVQMGVTKASLVEQARKDARAQGVRIGEALVAAGACRWDDIHRAVKVQGQLRRMTGVEVPGIPESKRA